MVDGIPPFLASGSAGYLRPLIVSKVPCSARPSLGRPGLARLQGKPKPPHRPCDLRGAFLPGRCSPFHLLCIHFPRFPSSRGLVGLFGLMWQEVHVSLFVSHLVELHPLLTVYHRRLL